MNWTQYLKEIIEHMGFRDYKAEFDVEHRHASIFVHDNPGLIKENLPSFVEAMNHIAQLVAQKNGEAAVFIDINNYRRERENLIAELARAAARKVLASKEPVSLPAMNSYERRLVHMELAAHPEVVTESKNEGKERYVVIKPLE